MKCLALQMKVAGFSCCELNRQGSAGSALGESGAMFSGVMGAGTSFATECTEPETSAQTIMREVAGRVLDCPVVSCRTPRPRFFLVEFFVSSVYSPSLGNRGVRKPLPGCSTRAISGFFRLNRRCA